MKFEFSNDVVKLMVDDRYVTLADSEEEFKLCIPVGNIKKAAKFLLDSVESTKKIGAKK
ncbi:hypothetical protein EDD76_102258 [Kineothrix alysoides]|uniref:Uncharacterized protein n=1 Tax=Kineothrix alysoides TaxID=1469948 RepID=A0A4R1R562_9FIRM|nr:hypothetical protein [Kineothrix alysoides]TCL60560.1 hypothetical protein EDD76_102258 [Kineothrix alysoides]